MTIEDDPADPTVALATLVQETDFDEIPTRVVDRAIELVIDNFGVALAGSTWPAGELILDYVESAVPGDTATLLTGTAASASGAALANGTLAGVLSYDDTFESMVIHPSSPVLAAAFTATELVGESGPQLLEGYVVGIETTYRVGRSTHPSHYAAGWHSTGTIGTFGATAAAASILDLDVDETRHALGIAGSSAAGLRKNGGSMTFAFHGGQAAQAGLRAAQLAEAGFTADQSVFDGPLNFGSVTCPSGEYDPHKIIPTDGEFEGIEDIGLKAYPCARVPQAAMDGLAEILAAEDLSGDDISSVVADFDPSLEGILDRPGPEDIAEARGSIEFCLGLVIARGRVTGRDFTDDALDDASVNAAMKKVRPRYDTDLDGTFSKYGARVTVETIAGDQHSKAVHHPPGSPANPLGASRLREKFLDSARLADVSAPDELCSHLASLGTLASIRPIMEAL